MLIAYLLHREHSITVFEANDYIGGHTNTISVSGKKKKYRVDTGFIVFNDWTYPNFIKLLRHLKVDSIPTSMSFGVQSEKSGLEYGSDSFNSLFAQRKNLLSPRFFQLLFEIVRFNRESIEVLKNKKFESVSLKHYLKERRYSKNFQDHFILPMGAAIWSSTPEQILKFPVQYFVRFFSNHGMLSIFNQPQWRVIRRGSKVYAEALTKSYRNRIRLNSPIQSIRRFSNSVLIKPKNSPAEKYDQVILATHSDQALALLKDPSRQEKEILQAIPYQSNETILHTDRTLLPASRRAWSSWNYFIPKSSSSKVRLTYYMNRLQSLNAEEDFCVTLNSTSEIDPNQIIRKIIYHHPLYNAKGFKAQKRFSEINGVNRTYFCGAYWGYGFHEDGVNSALAVYESFGKRLPVWLR